MVQVHTIDFAVAYYQMQVAIIHPEPIHRDKWHMTIGRELQISMWKSSPSLVGIAEGADHFTMKIHGELHWMLMKKFICKTKSMEMSVKE